MFKKIIYLISIVLGILVFFRISSSKKEFTFRDYESSLVPIKTKVTTSKKRVEKKVLNTLNERQKNILKLLEKRKVLLPSDIYARNPNVSTRTLRRDMTVLVSLNLAKQEGSTKDTRYILIS